MEYLKNSPLNYMLNRNTHKPESDALFRLIHSMNKVEKKHFKLYTRYHSRNAGSMNYLRLFDIIVKQKEYNENMIRDLQIVKNEHLRMLKHYLHNLILESMRVLSSKGNDLDEKLNNMLHYARLMREKGLSDEEIKFLKKAKELALKHERWGVLLEVLFMQTGRTIVGGDIKARQEIEADIDLLLDKLRNRLEYMKLASKTSMQVHKTEMQRGAEDKTLKKLFTHPLLQDEGKALSAGARNTYFNTIFQYHNFTGNYQEAYKIILQSVHFVESNYSSILLPDITYSIVLNNLTNVQYFLGKYKEALSTTQKHQLLVQKSGPVKAHAFVYSHMNETHYYITLGEFKKGAAILKDIEKGLEKFKLKTSDMAMMTLFVNISLLYFGVGEFRKSLIWVNKIISHPKIQFREDVQSLARILQILIHYELNTPDILQHLTVSTNRFLNTRERLFKVEESFLKFIRRLVRLENSPIRTGRNHPEQQKLLLAEFRKFRAELIQITKDPEERKTILFFDLISWLESKIEDRPFDEVVRKKIKKISGSN